MTKLCLVRSVLLGLTLATFAQVPVGLAQTGCPIPPAHPSQGDVNACKACIKKEYDERQAALWEQGWGVFATGVSGTVVTANPAGCLGAIPALIGVLVKAEAHGMDEYRKCMSSSECQRINNYKQSLRQYRSALEKYKDQQQAEANRNLPAVPRTHLCYMEEKSSDCPKDANWRFRVMTYTYKQEAQGNSINYREQHVSCTSWSCGKYNDKGHPGNAPYTCWGAGSGGDVRLPSSIRCP
jgi:hypothetical protein